MKRILAFGQSRQLYGIRAGKIHPVLTFTRLLPEKATLKMEYSDENRLFRLTAILIQLQTKRVVTASELFRKFEVSKRTIHRVIKALESAGVPILTEEGKGYTLMKGYSIPPVMFTDKQANALILAEQLVLNNRGYCFFKYQKNQHILIKNIEKGSCH